MKKIVLADAPNGAVVRVDGDWGVVCAGNYDRRLHLIVDFWDGGRTYVSPSTLVEVPTKRTRKEVAV